MADLLYLASKIFHNKIEDNKVTSPYGMRIHPLTKVEKMHNGVDFSSKTLPWKQYAIEDGYVYDAGVDTKYGNALYAWIAYPRLGIRLLHYHLAELYVKKAQEVNSNTVIGLTGKSGYSDGVHLHLGVKWLSNGKYFNPESIDLKEDEDVKVVEDLKTMKYTLVVDGNWGVATTKALQHYLGTIEDGVISGQYKSHYNQGIHSIKAGKGGSSLVKALQKRLGVTVDGYIGSYTIRALQKHLGVIQTGAIYSYRDVTVKELQKRLNEGTFNL